MHQITWRTEKMSDAALMKECAAPAIPGDTVKTQIARAARRLKWNYYRVFNAWYGKATLSAVERDEARAVMLKNTRDQEAIRREFQRNLQAVIGVAEAMARTDPTFFSNEIGQLRGLVGEARGDDLA